MDKVTVIQADFDAAKSFCDLWCEGSQTATMVLANIMSQHRSPAPDSEKLREAIVLAMSKDRDRFKEGSMTWNAYGFCINIALHTDLPGVSA